MNFSSLGLHRQRGAFRENQDFSQRSQWPSSDKCGVFFERLYLQSLAHSSLLAPNHVWTSSGLRQAFHRLWFPWAVLPTALSIASSLAGGSGQIWPRAAWPPLSPSQGYTAVMVRKYWVLLCFWYLLPTVGQLLFPSQDHRNVSPCYRKSGDWTNKNRWRRWCTLRAPESWTHVLALPWVSYLNSNSSTAECTVLNNTVLLIMGNWSATWVHS